MVHCNIVIVSGLMHQYMFLTVLKTVKMYKMKRFFTGSLQTFRFSKEPLSLYTLWSFFRLLKCSSHKKNGSFKYWKALWGTQMVLLCHHRNLRTFFSRVYWVLGLIFSYLEIKSFLMLHYYWLLRSLLIFSFFKRQYIGLDLFLKN